MKHKLKTIADMRMYAEEQLEPIDGLEFFGWTEVFASTSGPSGGIGGCMMTPFDVIAFIDNNTRKAILFCGNNYKFKTIKPNETMRWQ